MFIALNTIFLSICAVTDLMKRQIWWPLCVIVTVVAAVLHFIREERGIWEISAGVLLGAGLLFIAWATREAIGYGDGLVVAVCGSTLGIVTALQILLLALCFSAVWSGILLAFRKAGRRDRIPFVPFMLLAQCCLIICG